LTHSRLIKLCLLAAIILVAAFLRLYRIDGLPPSDGYDQATYGLDVLDILDGARPVFLPSNFGREALFSYLVTLVYLVIGDLATAVYATSALVGVLTVPAVYLAADELFRPLGDSGGKRPHPEPRGASPPRFTWGGQRDGSLARWGGLLAALVIATSRWHLSWSRLGMRAILVPFFAATTVYLLWCGLRGGRWWVFVACGFSLGLSLHSYQAARALPLLVLLAYGYVALARRSFTWRDVRNLALIALAAGLVFAPLGAYFFAHPGSSGLRIGQAVVVRSSQNLGDNLQILAEQVLNALLAILVRGDTDARVTVLGRPALDPFLSAALLLGIAFSILRLRRPCYATLLTWLAGLSAPAVLAQLGPVTKRAIGATPAVAMLVAVGCLITWDWARSWAARLRSPWIRALQIGLALLIGGGLLYSGVQTYYQYFRLWPQDPDLFTHFETGPSAIGRYLADLPPGEHAYLSPVPVDHHSVALNSRRRSDVKSYQGKFCFVAVDRAGQDATYIIAPAEDRQSLPLLESTYPQAKVIGEGPLHYGQPYFLALRVPAGSAAQFSPDYLKPAEWGAPEAAIQLLGFDLDRSSYRPGERLPLTLYYRTTGPLETDYSVFVHLLGPDNPATGGPLWAQDDSEPCRRSYPTSAWAPDETIVDHFSVTIPDGAPAGAYQITMGIYEWQTLQRLPVLDASGQPVADRFFLTQVQVAAP